MVTQIAVVSFKMKNSTIFWHKTRRSRPTAQGSDASRAIEDRPTQRSTLRTSARRATKRIKSSSATDLPITSGNPRTKKCELCVYLFLNFLQQSKSNNSQFNS